MTTLYITEYPGALQPIGLTSIVNEPENASQTVAIGASSTQSSAFAPNTATVRLHADAICSVKIGSNPTATATNRRMAAGQTEYFAVPQSAKVAVITNT